MTSREASLQVGRGGEPEPSTVLIVIYNAIYWPYLFTSVAVLFVPAVALFLLTFWWDEKRRVLHRYTCWWGGHYLAWAPFAGVTVEGRERAMLAGPCVYVANHQSMVDILAVFATRLEFLWVSKIENFYAPFLGWNMVLNRYVALKRGYLPSIMRMVRTCHRRLNEGHCLFVFPEGTRSPNGELIPFYSGAFRIAARNKVPIVPIVIEGTARVLRKGRFRIVPHRCHVSILEPLHPADVGFDHRRLHDLVRRRMQEEQARLRGRGPA